MKIVSITPLLIVVLSLVQISQAFISAPCCHTTAAAAATTRTTRNDGVLLATTRNHDNDDDDNNYDDDDDDTSAANDSSTHRRQLLLLAGRSALTSASLLWCSAPAAAATAATALADDPPAYLQEYSDFTESPTGGWRYRDAKRGTGATAKKGDRVVFDWSGYTIGYFGRPFQAKGGPVGGAFDKDLELSRTVLGSGRVVRGLDEALQGMAAGGVRQLVLPYSTDFSYPPDDLTHERVGPKPTTFSGQRALNFVLENQRLDRTLLFNVKVVRVDPSDGKGGFSRGDR